LSKIRLEPIDDEFFGVVMDEFNILKKRVKCSECAHFSEVIVEHNSLGDSYCPVADQRLVAGARNGQAFRTWRKCPHYKPNS